VRWIAGATAINEEMKMAAVRAIAALAREEAVGRGGASAYHGRVTRPSGRTT
jgi:malic enzyme